MHDSNSSGKKPIEEVQALRPRKPKLERLRPEAAEYKKVEEALRQSEQYYRGLVNCSTDVIWRVNLEGILTFVSPSAKALCGFEAEELIGAPLEKILTENGVGKARESLMQRKRGEFGKEPIIFELVHRRKDGTEFVAEIRSAPIFGENGEVVGIQGITRDITERKRAEEALRDSEREKSAILDSMSELVVYQDRNMRILWANKAAGESVGLKSERLVGRYCYEIWHGRSEVCAHCPVVKARETGQPQTAEIATPDGRRWFLRGYPLKDANGNIVGVVEVTQDITERKNAEELLRNAEKEWRNSFDSLEDVVLIIDTDYNIENINEAGLKLLAKSKEETIGKKCYQVIGDADSPPEECPCKKSLKTKKVESLDRYEKKFCKYFSIKISPIFDENGEIIKFVDLRRDITERKKAEESLQKQKDKVQKYLDIAGVMFVAINAGGEITLINKKGREILGYEEKEIFGKNWFDNFLPKRLVDGIKQVSEKLLTGKLNAAEYFENPVLTKSGEERLIAWHNTILKDENGKVIGHLSSGQDITERKRADEKLLDYQAQLKSLASQLTLAEEHERRRIATELHDQISQSLVVSKLKLEALHESAASEELGNDLNEVCNSLGQTIAETRSLTSEVHSPLLSLLGFEAAVAEWLTEQIEGKHGIAIEFKDDGQPKPLDDDIRILLFRDVRELLTNVVRHAHAHKVRVSIRKVGSRIRVKVEDYGIGFDPSEITWMPARTGGFGLFSIRERLEEVGGRLKIESKPGHGTTVAITAPLKAEKNAEGR
ncbi:MAG TPA: PAS domain S-box protein [Planctomycetes bacterium]|nr:PAS domain S-box protein [Planctomycetota bacterium]